MIGVATPSDLIKDEKRTPFNIGHGVELNDFTPWEALPLVGDLGAEVLRWVFAWTGGHPYLTQRLCRVSLKGRSRRRPCRRGRPREQVGDRRIRCGRSQAIVRGRAGTAGQQPAIRARHAHQSARLIFSVC